MSIVGYNGMGVARAKAVSRQVPFYGIDDAGIVYLLGYGRTKRSRKVGMHRFKKPIPLGEDESKAIRAGTHPASFEHIVTPVPAEKLESAIPAVDNMDEEDMVCDGKTCGGL